MNAPYQTKAIAIPKPLDQMSLLYHTIGNVAKQTIIAFTTLAERLYDNVLFGKRKREKEKEKKRKKIEAKRSTRKTDMDNPKGTSNYALKHKSGYNRAFWEKERRGTAPSRQSQDNGRRESTLEEWEPSSRPVQPNRQKEEPWWLRDMY